MSVGTSPLELHPGTSTAPSSVAVRGELYSGLRPLRTLAMLSIVAYHINWIPLFGVAFGLISLQVIMAALATRHERAKPLLAVARRRGRRLLRPWIAWCLIYALFEIGVALSRGKPALGAFDHSMWLSGTSFHLWFLPFAFVASVVANRASWGTAWIPRPIVILLLASLGAALVIAAPLIHREFTVPHPFDLWIDGAGTIAFGVAIGRALSSPEYNVRLCWLLFITVLAALPVYLGPELAYQTPLFARYGIAVPLACLGMIIRVPDGKGIAWLAGCNLGVYVVHMIVLRGLGQVSGFVELGFAMRLLIAYGLCLATVVVIRKLRIPSLV